MAETECKDLVEISKKEWELTVINNIRRDMRNLLNNMLDMERNLELPKSFNGYKISYNLVCKIIVNSRCLDMIKKDPEGFKYFKTKKGKLDLKYKNENKPQINIPGYS